MDAGHRHHRPGEEPAVAGAREVLEEAGVVAVAERLTWVHALPPMAYDNGDRAQYLDHTFRFRYVSGEPFPADGENTEAAWYALDALPPMSAEMHARIASALPPPDRQRSSRESPRKALDVTVGARRHRARRSTTAPYSRGAVTASGTMPRRSGDPAAASRPLVSTR